MNKRICPLCHCSKVIKFGKQTARQRYRCQQCRRTFTAKAKPQRKLKLIKSDFFSHKYTVKLLSEKYHLHPNTIRKVIHQVEVKPIVQKPRVVSVIMDVTYFNRSFGVLVVIDPNAQSDENVVLYYKFIDHSENNTDYLVATDTVEAMGYEIISATIDGRRGVKEMLENKHIPVQYCQFHQLQTINQCLTKRPQLPQHQELRDLALTLTKTDYQTFSYQLAKWYSRYGEWLKERYQDESGRLRYRHDRCRRAYFSLKRHLPNLFVYQADKTHRTRNTTSPLDGRFGVWKDKLKAHRGITRTLKVSMLCNFFSEATGVDNN